MKNIDKNQTSNLTITVISIIGSGLIGLGALFFIKSYWDSIPEIVKIGTLFLSSIAAYATGYYCKYQRKTIPIVGGSLLLLGALLFGAAVLTTGHMYGMSVWYDHRPYLIWLLGVIPAIYAFASVPLAALAVAIFMYWSFNFYAHYATPLHFLLAGVFLYNLGCLHYFWERLKNIGLVYKIFGIHIILLSLLDGGIPSSEIQVHLISKLICLFVISGIALVLAIFNYFYNTSNRKVALLELIYTCLLFAAGFLVHFLSLPATIVSLIFNFLFTQIVFLQLFSGYCTRDMVQIGTGTFWLIISVMSYYWEFVKGSFPGSFFMMLVGAILVTAGVLLEKKRRDVKAFSQEELRGIKIIFFVAWLAFFAVVAFFILMRQPGIMRVKFF